MYVFLRIIDIFGNHNEYFQMRANEVDKMSYKPKIVLVEYEFCP